MFAAGIATTSGIAATGPRAPQTQMVLRLHELPSGYVLGGDVGCGVFGVEDAPQSVEEFATRYRPTTCEFEYERLYTPPGAEVGPALVESYVIGTDTAQGAGAGYAIAGEILKDDTGDLGLAEVPLSLRVGDQAKLFHTQHALVDGLERRPGSALFWRSGNTLAAIYVAGPPIAESDAAALRLAQLQQRHIEAPTPYTAAERDDTLVPLEDPAIPVPVYWLGATFTPGHGLPPAHLSEAFFVKHHGEAPPGMKGLLEYDRIGDLTIYTRPGWKQRLRSSLGPLVRGWRCTSSRRIGVPGGRATIYSGYAKDFARCPGRAPDVFLAEVHLGHVVVGVNLPNCTFCVEPDRGPYASPSGLATVARSLQLRP